MRLLLVLTVIIAVTVLLWGSWQWGRRPFYLVLSLVLAGLMVLGIGVWQGGRDDQVRLPPDGIQVTLKESLASESGVRLTGNLANRSEMNVAAVTLQARALSCPQTENGCTVIYQQTIDVQMYLPAGQDYPFAVVSRHPKEDTPVDRWELEAIDKLVYPQS
ncbi:MAG: hypothetical protein ACFE0K_10810 [Alcanivorax sp.]|uniref:hypothetical protein n=1 Tax=Alcanivorax sp. TaxID=1872427 RepID=UPI003DA75D5D